MRRSVNLRALALGVACTILLSATASAAEVRVMISGSVEVNPEHSNSTAGRVAQGSSEMQSAHNAPWYFGKFLMASSFASSNK